MKMKDDRQINLKEKIAKLNFRKTTIAQEKKLADSKRKMLLL